MDIRKLRDSDGKTPLIEITTMGDIYLWMQPLIMDLDEDGFWKWLNTFYEDGPTDSQIEELAKITNPENTDKLDFDPHWNLWCAIDLIWQFHYDDWKSRGYNPNVTGGWYWRKERERMQKFMDEKENQDLRNNNQNIKS